jgi:hypothetical protein
MSVRLSSHVIWALWADTNVSDKQASYIFRVGDIPTRSEVKITQIPLHVYIKYPHVWYPSIINMLAPFCSARRLKISSKVLTSARIFVCFYLLH